jgi:iron-sulfur cluster repair protein YtfE (RIC family)
MATPRTEQIDTSMMIAMHDAFRRDMVHLARSTARSSADDPARLRARHAGWEIFKTQLHTHHRGEDTSLWPRLRTRLAGRSDDLALLDAMESEHGLIDPLLASIDAALEAEAGHPVAAGGPGTGRVGDLVDALVTDLSAHLRHEERDALPLIARTLTVPEWDAIAVEQRKGVGIRGAAQFLPWLLDSQDAQWSHSMYSSLPAPARLVYRRILRPRYQRRNPWAG